jgi:hypothetical protein
MLHGDDVQVARESIPPNTSRKKRQIDHWRALHMGIVDWVVGRVNGKCLRIAIPVGRNAVPGSRAVDENETYLRSQEPARTEKPEIGGITAEFPSQDNPSCSRLLHGGDRNERVTKMQRSMK